MIKRTLLLALLTVAVGATAVADKGMWLPSLISSRIKDMRSKGFRLTAEDIYSINKASLKDAVVLFDGGCTGEIVSPEGLLLTNHHCGYDAIQALSSVDHDYLTDGYWAKSRSGELPCKGLQVAILVRMEDITDRLAGGESAEAIVAAAKAEGKGYAAAVEQMYYGNEQYLFVYRVFDDVRLVGTPPSSIGKFGGDTDNWIWPRHTGDFSVFRIYASPDNEPAAYSKANVPYRPARHFEISTRGVGEGDFTMIYGFPGNTQEYITSDAVDYIANLSDPVKIALRTERLDIIREAQQRDAKVRIQYAAKHATIANAWKKWQGEVLGIRRLGTLDKKRAYEARFAAENPSQAFLLDSLHAAYERNITGYYLRELFNETLRAIEMPQMVRFAMTARDHERKRTVAAEFYKNYDAGIDRAIARRMMSEFVRLAPEGTVPDALSALFAAHGGAEAYADYIYDNSSMTTFDGLVGGDASADAAGASLRACVALCLSQPEQRARYRTLVPPLRQGAYGVGSRARLLPRCQPHAAGGLRQGRRIRICRRRVSSSANHVGGHHRQGQPRYLRLRYPAVAARRILVEAVRPLGHRSRLAPHGARMLHRDEPYHWR